MEEFCFLLGWLFRASNWLPDFVPSVALRSHSGVALLDTSDQ
jgi:hypothetical protein